MWEIIVLTIGALAAILILATISFLSIRYYQNRHIKDGRDLEKIVEGIGENYISKPGNVGLVIGIIKNEKVFIKGFGKIRKQTGTSNGNNDECPGAKTIFELASIGKVFTASAAQILADRGEISLDDTIDTYLNSKVKVCEKAKNVTLRHLATHTSGFPSFPKSFLSKIKDPQNPYKHLTVQDLYGCLAKCAENSEPGRYKYSNLGMGCLGHILEIKTGKSYESIIKDEITGKLGLQNTTITLSDEQQRLLAQGYDKKGNPNPVWEDGILTGAGSFLGSAEDMIQFIRSNFDGRQSEISKSLVKTHAKQPNGKTGLGWHYYSKFFSFITDEGDVIWHNGGTGGSSSFAALNKKTKSGVIVLSNSTNEVTSLGRRLNFYSRHISFAEN